MNFIKTEDLPKDVRLSPDLKKRAKFFVVVMLFGVNYYIPVTKEMKRFFNIRIKDGKPYRTTSQAGSYDQVDFLRDLIASAYFQVRDTVGSAIHDNLKKLKVHQLEDKSEKQVLYDGFVKVMKDIKTGFEIVSVTDSVAFLIWNKNKDEVLFTLQYRAPVGCSLTEVPAGRIDKDIDVKELVVKEAQEEVGVTITEDDIILLNNGKPLTVAPGVLTERCYLAYVEVSSSMIEESNRVFGIPEEGEEIQRIFIPVNDLYMMEFEDMKTYALILHFLKERMEKTLGSWCNCF
jgi:8-oxo-dGTP pyrophosphatase MutT (NUDIX family)